MPSQILPPSPFLGQSNDAPADVAASLGALAIRFEAPTSLEGAGHVLPVFSRGLGAILELMPAAVHELQASQDESLRLQGHFPLTQTLRLPPLLRTERLCIWPILSGLSLAIDDKRLWRVVGAIVILAGGRGQATQNQLRALYAVAQQGDQVAPATLAALMVKAGPLVDRVLARFASRKGSRATAASDALEANIERRWIDAMSFLQPSRAKGLPGKRGLLAAEIELAATQVRAVAEAGSGLAVAIALAFWIGLRLFEMLLVTMLLEPGTGLVRLSGDCSGVIVNLRGVLSRLAKAHPDAEKTSDCLWLALPVWLQKLLQALRSIDPDARNLAELLQLSPRTRMRWVPGTAAQADERISVAAFIDSRAQTLSAPAGAVTEGLPPLELQAEDEEAKAERLVHNNLAFAYAMLDFRCAEKSAYPYQRIPHQQVLEVSRTRAARINWGPLADVPAGLQAIGSRNTPPHQAVLDLVAARAQAVADTRCGPRSGWQLLTKMFNALILYVLLMLTLGWLLRGRRELGVPASILRYKQVSGWSEKAVEGSTGVTTSLLCGTVLAHQLDLVHLTVESMTKRAEGLQKKGHEIPSAVLTHLKALATCDPAVDVLQVIEGEQMRPVGHADLAAGLSLKWEFERDALRHVGADGHAEVGTPSSCIELMLRHLTSTLEVLTSAAGLSMLEWREFAGAQQDSLLTAFGLEPLAGLVWRGIK